MITFPIPLGLSQADLADETTLLFDYGDCVALYSSLHGMGGVYRRDPGVWQLWFPIGLEDFSTAMMRFLKSNGFLDQAEYSVVTAPYSMRLN